MPAEISDAEAIAAYIATRGVRRCPAAIAATSTAEIPAADREALAAYYEARNAPHPFARHTQNGPVMTQRQIIGRHNAKPARVTL